MATAMTATFLRWQGRVLEEAAAYLPSIRTCDEFLNPPGFWLWRLLRRICIVFAAWLLGSRV
jgi:hypothetical protein